MFNILAGISKYLTVVSFPSHCSSSLSALALGPTVIFRVYSCLDLGPESKQVDCNMCRISNCSSFFSAVHDIYTKDGSDRLMKRASCSCRVFVCVVIAAT